MQSAIKMHEKDKRHCVLYYPPVDIRVLSPAVKKTIDLCSVYSYAKYFMDLVSMASLKHNFSNPSRALVP